VVNPFLPSETEEEEIDSNKKGSGKKRSFYAWIEEYNNSPLSDQMNQSNQSDNNVCPPLFFLNLTKFHESKIQSLCDKLGLLYRNEILKENGTTHSILLVFKMDDKFTTYPLFLAYVKSSSSNLFFTSPISDSR
jgi:hypothetical protein